MKHNNVSLMLLIPFKLFSKMDFCNGKLTVMLGLILMLTIFKEYCLLIIENETNKS